MRERIADISDWFLEHSKLAGIVFLTLLVGGVLAYTSLLKREGFPSIQFPLVIVNGGYFVNDAQQVDADVVLPISEGLTTNDQIENVQTIARDNSFTATVFLRESVTPVDGLDIVQTAVHDLDLPEQMQVSYTPINPAGFLFEYDALVAVYDSARQASNEQLETAAAEYVRALEAQSEISEARVESLF